MSEQDRGTDAEDILTHARAIVSGALAVTPRPSVQAVARAYVELRDRVKELEAANDWFRNFDAQVKRAEAAEAKVEQLVRRLAECSGEVATQTNRANELEREVADMKAILDSLGPDAN